MHKISGESQFTYTWKIQGDDFGDISGDCKYTCLPCGEKYDRPRNFHEHIRGVEKKRKRVMAVYVVWKCEGCEAVFRGLSGLANHYENGCKEMIEEMGALRKEKEHWNELDEAMKKQMGIDDGDDVVVLDYEELTSVTYEGDADDEDEDEENGWKDGNKGKKGKNDKEEESREGGEGSDEDDEEEDEGVEEETGCSESSSEGSEEEYAGDKPTGLENMISSMGIVRAGETSGDEIGRAHV